MSGANWLTITTQPPPSTVDGRACRTRAAFFTEVARALHFPDYFGHNWDALLDSLRDLGAIELVVGHAEALLADESGPDLAILLRVLATAASDGLTVVLSTDSAHEPALRDRIANATNPRE